MDGYIPKSSPKHNMAKSLQLALLITGFLMGFLFAECFAQRQICSYYGMNLFLFYVFLSRMQLSLFHSLSNQMTSGILIVKRPILLIRLFS